MVTAEGPGLAVSPSKKFIGSLNASSSVELPFSVTPDQASDLTFTISYQAGDNTHSTEVILPITLGDDKTAAVPMINNVALTSRGTYYDITGDVTNAGISAAKGLVIMVDAPAQGTGKYPEYAIGSLASDDSSSFELTFTAPDLSQVPLILRWKDSLRKQLCHEQDARPAIGYRFLRLQCRNFGIVRQFVIHRYYFRQFFPADLYRPGGNFQGGQPGGGSMLGMGRGNGISAFYPVIAGGIILVVAIVLYVKRKPIKAKLAGMKQKKEISDGAPE